MCQAKQSNDVVCPTCGTCPTCGKMTWGYNQYYYPFYKPDPTWPQYQYYQYQNTTSDNSEEVENGK